MKELHLNLDRLSPERVASDAAAEKVVTPSATKLRADGCAAELLPYDPHYCPYQKGSTGEKRS